MSGTQTGSVLAVAVDRATAAFRATQDRIGQFLAECTIDEEAGSVRSDDLYTAWKAWCDFGNDGRPGRIQDFTMAVEDAGYRRMERDTRERRRDKRFMGLTLVEHDRML